MSSPSSSNGPGFLSAEALLAAIVDSCDDAIVSKDLNGVVTSWNRGAERTFGYTAAEMVGQPILRLIPHDRQSEEPAILERLRRGERVDHFQTIRRRKDGTLIDVSLTISPVRNAAGDIVGASKIARDITTLKEAISKIEEANEALRRADRMKAEFISTLSHELRTPLNAIAGWLQILSGDAPKEEIEEGLEVIRRNVKAQTQLIGDLLDMSRIEAGKLTLDVQRVDIPSVVAAAMDAVRPAAMAKGVQLTSTFASVEGVVMGDRTRLQQVIWNLLTNAVKFTQRGGSVHITTQRMDSHMAITVTDTGAGIPPEQLERIFERFTQADSSTVRSYGGLGIGLSIAKHLTELHGGSIVAKSDGVGKGASFLVRVPLAAVQPELASSGSGDDPNELDDTVNLKGVKVLVLDDEPDSLNVVRKILERSGATVFTASSVNDALAAAEKFQPEIVISDIGMPEHDGYEFIAELRAMPMGRRLPAIALTALARNEDRTRALKAGFQVHLAKPVEAAELTAAVLNLASLAL